MSTVNQATDFHSKIAQSFAGKYEVSKDFQQRFAVWRELLDQYGVAGQRVLDAGCGPGHLAFHAASLGCEVVAVDGSDQMIDHCRDQQSKNGATNITWIHDHFPIGDRHDLGQFDVVCSSSVIEYVDCPVDYLKDLDSKLNPHGHLFLSVPNAASFYKKFESVIYRLTGKPEYLTHSKHSFTERQLVETLSQLNYVAKEVRFYGSGRWPAGTVLSPFGEKRSKNILVVAFEKQTGCEADLTESR